MARGSYGVDVAPVAGQLLQLGGRRGVGCPGHLHSRDFLHDRDLRQRLGPLVAVQGEGQRLADALVVEGLLLVVDDAQQDAVPRALLHRDLVAEGLHQAVTLGGAETPELDVGPLAADHRDLRRRRGHEHGPEAVEVGLALVPVVGVLLPHHVGALHVLDELEGAGAHDVLLVPVDVLGQCVRLVDEVVGRGQGEEEGALRVLQAEAHRGRVRRLDHLDRPVLALAARPDALRREDDLVVGRLDVFRRHLGPVVELDPSPELERVGEALLRHGPALGQIADGFGAGGVSRIDPEERAVEGRERVDEPERLLPVAVVRGRFRGHREDELAPLPGLLRPDGHPGAHPADDPCRSWRPFRRRRLEYAGR